MARRRGRGGRWRTAPLAMLLTLATALLAGCAAPTLPWQAHSPAPLPDAQQILRLSLPGYNPPAVNLDPDQFYPGDLTLQFLMPLLYSTLFTLDAQQRPVPLLATGYDVSADGLRSTIHLRADARFTDGTPLTSSDVAFSLNRAIADCASDAPFAFSTLKDEPRLMETLCLGSATPNQPPTSSLIGDALLTPDPQTLVIVLSQPDGALAAKLAEPYCGIVERAIVMQYGNTWAQHLADGGGQGTSGMYRLANTSAYNAGRGLRMTLERVSHSWGAVPRLRQVILDLYPRDSLATGDVIFDGGDGFSQQRVSGMAWHTAPTRADALLTLDPQEPGLSDIRVRQELALTVDKIALAKSMGAVATNHLTPPGIAGYPTALSGPIASAPLTGDVAQAQALLRSYVADKCGGSARACPRIFVWDVGWTGGMSQMFPLFDRWKAALPGLPVIGTDPPDLLPVSCCPYYSARPLTWYEDYPDPQDWLSYFAQVPAFQPIAHDATADALVMSAEDTHDPTARLALYHEAEETVINDAVVVPIAQLQMTWGVSPTVINFPANPAPYIAPSAWARIYLTAPASG
jgi:peptide/nickel transport system substrate-binding protein/oligopeptide transport system substrate-binding protein